MYRSVGAILNVMYEDMCMIKTLCERCRSCIYNEDYEHSIEIIEAVIDFVKKHITVSDSKVLR